MAKKLFLVIYLSVLGLLFIVMAGEGGEGPSGGTTQADVSALFQEADAHEAEGLYEQAEGIYQQIVSDYPGTDYALEAQKNLAIMYAKLGNDTAVLETCERLVADFPEHQGRATAVTHIADAYRELGKYRKACEFYNYVIADWPGDEHAMWSQMGLVISNIGLQDDKALLTAFEKLITEYSGLSLLPRAVCIIADSYRKVEENEEARDIYQYALDSWPDAEFALWSQMGLAISSLQLGDLDAAGTAAAELLADFSTDERMSVAVCLLADEYRKLEQHETSSVLYQYIIDNWPDAEHALWSGMGLAISNIRVGYEYLADAVVEQLLVDFFEDERMAIAGCLIADEYRKLEKYEQAFELYQYVVDNWPQTEHAMWSRTNMGDMNIQLGNGATAQAVLDGLLTDFSGDPILPEAVAVMADGYYTVALRLQSEGLDAGAAWFYRKAIAECERVVTQLPETHYTTAECCYFWAVCHSRLGEYTDAIEQYQMVVDNWPDYRLAWSALFRIGRCYRELRESGLMPQSQANPLIGAVYQQLLEEYPDCKMAGYAGRWLSRHHHGI